MVHEQLPPKRENWSDSIRDFKIAMKFKELDGFVYDKKNIKQQVDERRTKIF
jgi:predicted RNase H-like nuclease